MPVATPGARFGRLVLAEIVGKAEGSYHKLWRCLCDCGREVVVARHAMVNQKSCGCLNAERTGETAGPLTAERLREILRYEPETGRFFWLTKSGRRRKGDATDEAGWSVNGTYRQIRIGGRLYKSARLAFLYMEGKWPPAHVDHINGNRSDDRWSNLRPASTLENRWNVGKCANPKSSSYKGVYFDRANQRWVGQIRHGGVTRFLGRFPSEEAAAEAYNEAALAAFGEFARLNQIEAQP